jgi:hypothetical protein
MTRWRDLAGWSRLDFERLSSWLETYLTRGAP